MPATAKAPSQARSEQTRRDLLDSFERLLLTKGFAEITVSEIAAEAGVSTGAIYGRFADKRDLLRAAFDRFHERTAERNDSRETIYVGLADVDVIRNVVAGTLDYSLEHLPLMRAAAALDDAPSFDRMRQARSEVADWLAGRLESSTLAEEERVRRCRFALRMVTAVIRDTFLAGPGATTVSAGDPARLQRLVDDLVDELTVVAASYLQVDDTPHAQARTP